MSSPINSLEVESGVPPLNVRSYITEKFCLILISRDNVLVSPYHKDFIFPNCNSVPLPALPSISESIEHLNIEFHDTVH